jgi:hypothetical protein
VADRDGAVRPHPTVAKDGGRDSEPRERGETDPKGGTANHRDRDLPALTNWLRISALIRRSHRSPRQPVMAGSIGRSVDVADIDDLT